MEYCTLVEAEDGFLLSGQVNGLTRGVPFSVQYRVECDPKWQTRSVGLSLGMGGRPTGMRIMADDKRQWWLDGRELEDVRGCEFVDLGVTPSTNTLPIRAFDLPVGAGREFVAAWIRFPDLAMLPLRQRYTRLSDRLYRYESLVNGKTGFVAELSVDGDGLVIDYQGVWKREVSGKD
jgi:hypothetical protein